MKPDRPDARRPVGRAVRSRSTLDEIVGAHRHLERGEQVGKIVVTAA